MTLREFGLLTNENIAPAVVAFLRTQGFDVTGAVGTGLVGAEDAAVLRRARADNRVVVTHDADFGRLALAAGEPMIGIVYLRPGHIEAQFTIAGLRALLDRDPSVTPPFVVVVQRTRDRIKIRVRSSR